MRRVLSVLALVAVAGCQCNLDDTNLGEITDAGFTDAGFVVPPVFPLKVGDQVQYPVVGGQTADCDDSVTPGDCQLTLRADFIIKDTILSGDNRWVVVADVVYQGSADLITQQAIAPLILENAAPFDRVTPATPESAENVQFTSNAVPNETLNALGWPFFEYRVDDATLFEEVGATFCESWREVDADAECEVQHGDQKFEVYFKDSSAGAAKLHKLRAEYHQMGFICGWDEAMVPFTDGVTERNEAAFGGAGLKDLAAQFFAPRIVRDGVQYQCSCVSQQCRANNDTCLTIDPEAAPGPCE